eukprot:679358_1
MIIYPVNSPNFNHTCTMKTPMIMVLLIWLNFATCSALDITAGGHHTCALSKLNTTKCFGKNEYGQLGLGDATNVGDAPTRMMDSMLPIDLGTDFNPIQIAAGYFHNCALSHSNAVKCWGWGEHAQIGLGDKLWRGNNIGEMGNDLPEVDLGTNFNAVSIAAGGYHTCAISHSNAVKCWGRNDYWDKSTPMLGGQLGLGDIIDRGNLPDQMGNRLPEVDLGTNFNAVSIAAGGYHTCAISHSNAVKCWGRNDYWDKSTPMLGGQLGLGDIIDRGNLPDQMGNRLPEVDLGTNFNAVSIAAGGYHTCALSSSNAMKCWGSNQCAQLGLGDFNERGNAAGEMGDNLSEIDLGPNFIAIQMAAGLYHTCALSEAQTVKCWGCNTHGELGYGDTNHRGDDASDMGDNLLEVDLGVNFNAIQIVCGYEHTCALSEAQTVKCWGNGADGQLGQGDTNNRGDGPDEMGTNLLEIDLGLNFNAIQIVSGGYHTCASSNANTMKCFGRGHSGQLGSGDIYNRGDDTNDMGENLLEIYLGQTFETQISPTRNPTNDPSTAPTNDPSTTPSFGPINDPSTAPTNDPTKVPTKDPSNDPTAVTTAPTVAFTSNPSMASNNPTMDPTTAPTETPTAAPLFSPTIAPLSLVDAIRGEQGGDQSIVNTDDIYIYCVLFGIPLILILFVFLIKSTILKDKLISVDTVKYVTVALYFLQIFDFYSDVMFTIELHSYHLWATNTDYDVTSDEQNTFFFLFIFGLTFTILPFCANFVSSIRIVHAISSDALVSNYSKEWMKFNSSVYSIAVLLSGGSFFALQVVNSNFLGLPQLSGGLSTKQIQCFASHKLYLNTLLENLPQAILQCYCLIVLEVKSGIVLISLIFSGFNVLLSVLSALTRRASFGIKQECPFVIYLSVAEDRADSSGNPYHNAKRINELSRVLKSLSKQNQFDIEIMSFSLLEKSLYGVVLHQDASMESIKAFMRSNVDCAIRTAFEWNVFKAHCYYPLDLDLDTANNNNVTTIAMTDMKPLQQSASLLQEFEDAEGHAIDVDQQKNMK